MGYLIRSSDGTVLTPYDVDGTVLEAWGKAQDLPERPALVDPASPYGITPEGSPGYTGQLIFSDEFTGPDVDYDKWLPRFPDGANYALAGPLSNGHGSAPGVADEPQIYDPSAISIDNRTLRLEMRNEQQPDWPTYPYTSGMLCSWPTFDLPGGFVEARMRYPAIPGSWPAFWMLSATTLAWPPEIDVMENWGQSPSYVKQTVWYLDRSNQGGGAAGSAGVWHTYGCHWTPGGTITWYVDGVQTNQVTNANITSDSMYLVVNLAGDHRYGLGPNPSSMPFTLDVEYVRAWALP